MKFRNMFIMTFWPQWLMFSTVSIVIGWAVAEAMFFRTEYFLTLYTIAMGIPGVVLGVGQWFVLRSWIRQAWWWILATAVGWGIGWYIGVSVPMIQFGGKPFLYADRLVRFAGGMAVIDNSITGIAVFATIIGLLQGIVLWRWVRWAIWWVPARVVVTVLGWVVIVAILGIFRSRGPHVFILSGISAEALMGLILIWLLQHPKDKIIFEPENKTFVPQNPIVFWVAITIVLVCFLAAIAGQLLLALGSIPLLFFGKLKPQTQKIAIIGGIIIVLSNILSALAVYWFYYYQYGDWWWKTLLIFAIFGFIGAYYGTSVVDGILTAFYVSVADSTIGWSIPWILGPGAVWASNARILMSIIIGWITAIGLGLVFGWLGRVFSRNSSETQAA